MHTTTTVQLITTPMDTITVRISMNIAITITIRISMNIIMYYLQHQDLQDPFFHNICVSRNIGLCHSTTNGVVDLNCPGFLLREIRKMRKNCLTVCLIRKWQSWIRQLGKDPTREIITAKIDDRCQDGDEH